ncbi:MAG: twin-arginine translocation signal domain-containing protein [Actinobacteria bacterium]|nr:twin-arginine translocation signal domain-containing protein [Actinomycetota bacterium]
MITRREFLQGTATVAGLAAARGLTAYDTAWAGNAHCRWGVMATPRSGETWREAVTHLERKVGRRYSVIRRYHVWNEPLPTKFETWYSHHGRTPYVAWHAFDDSGKAISWTSIAAGDHDRWIHHQARRLKHWGRPMYFSFHHEPENDANVCGSPAEFRAAWDRVRSVFASVHVPRLTWVATLMASTYAGNDGGPRTWLPARYGLLGVDGYNRGPCAGSDAWKTFPEIFGSAHRFARHHRKGLFIGEFGCVEQDSCNNGSGDPDAKARWFDHARSTIKSWPQVRVACYSHTATSGNAYWVDSSPQSLKAYQKVSSDPYFT